MSLEKEAQDRANQFRVNFCILTMSNGARFVWPCGESEDRGVEKFSPQPEQPKVEYTGPLRRRDDAGNS